jgi:alpha-N-arabinofuranosidase
VVRIANLAQLVNAIAPIFTNPRGLFLQTIYHPLRLYAEHTREHALDIHVDSPVYDLPAAQEEQSVGRVHHVSDLGPFPLLDAVASCDAAGRELTLAVVNRDRDAAHRAVVELIGASATGPSRLSEVNGPDVSAMNSFDAPRVVDVRERTLELKGHRVELDFPPHSVTVMRTSLSP